ncbi:hypothetical protein AB5I39_13235 [Sphingomonas sp. MMS24-J45]|uniref:hypothetical protein n=1 Tax=Sphingomonas sp. MMS24-J45 TaxID=3238806 RepID=UPI00384BEEF0
MRPIFALALLAASAAAPAPAPPSPTPVPTPPVNPADTETDAAADIAVTPVAPIRTAPKVTPFAPQFSTLPVITRPNGWAILGHDAAWGALLRSNPDNRQAARWAYARSQIGLGHAAEAIGAIEVMRQDEPDIVLVPSFQLALGATLTLLHRSPEAVTALSVEPLTNNPEACAWRMLALAEAEADAPALGQVQCAIPALNARAPVSRAPFLLAVARSAERLGKPAIVLMLLRTLPADHAAAELLRGRALIALRRAPEGKLALARAAATGDRAEKLDSELSTLEAAVAAGATPADAIQRLRHIRYVWRGGQIEERALVLSYQLARSRHDLRGTLEAGATLFRYFNGGSARPTLVAELQNTIAAALAPDNPMPLDQIAGLYWDYRDLAPGAADGDLLVSHFADRLQAAGLYARAAELLEHQLMVRTKDIAQGPLSARVASLFILAGEPDRALAAIRATEANAYPEAMLWDRHRVEAVALDQLGRTNEAMAVLQEVPDGLAIRGELYWKRRDWRALAAVTEPTLTGGEKMTDVMQAKVLRYAIALAMLGREDALARLHDRYRAAFGKLPSAAVFETLTAAIGEIDPATVSAAMAAIPSASPAGDIADLVDAAPVVAPPAG